MRLNDRGRIHDCTSAAKCHEALRHQHRHIPHKLADVCQASAGATDRAMGKTCRADSARMIQETMTQDSPDFEIYLDCFLAEDWNRGAPQALAAMNAPKRMTASMLDRPWGDQ